MNSLSTELKGVIARRLELAGAREILAIASALCLDEQPSVRARANSAHERFVVDDDVVTDRSTGLVWTRSNITAKPVPQKDAAQACKDCRTGNFDDWRLPTIKELLTLVDYERHSPAIDTAAFNCESAWYWSSTAYAQSPSGCAWGVDFSYGGAYCGIRGSSGFVRAVRVGQSLG